MSIQGSRAGLTLRILCLTGAILFAVGCGPQNNRPPLASTTDPFALLPPPNELPYVARTSSFANDPIFASNFADNTPTSRVSVDGTAASFAPDFAIGSDPGKKSPAFALYSLTYLGFDPRIFLNWETNPANSDLWIGVADYESDVWRWSAASVGSSSILQLEPLQDVPAGDCLIAVVLLGSSAHTLNTLRIGGDYPSDSILAVPFKTTANFGESVPVTVFLNQTANAMRFSYARVVVAKGCHYESNSFNIGQIGGAPQDSDGLWQAVNPGGGFLLAPDNFIVETDLGDGLVGIDFNITPIGGSDILSATGALFNFKLVVNTDTNISFQRERGVGTKRTFYADSSATEHFWASDDNQGMAGIDTPYSIPPVAVLSAAPTSGTLPLAVSFDGASSYALDGALVEYLFNSGTGQGFISYRLQSSASVYYESAGDFFASLRVVDSNGKSHATQKTIHVEEPLIATDSIFTRPSKFYVTQGDKVRLTIRSNETDQLTREARFRLIMDGDCNYVADSLNAGAPGGDPNAIDGIWSNGNGTSVALTPESSVIEHELGGGKRYIDVWAEQVGGFQIAQADGAILNLELQVNSDTILSFEQGTQDNPRTYYAGDDGTPVFWTDCANAPFPNLFIK